MSASASSASAAIVPEAPVDPRRWKVLVVVSVAVALIIVDSTISWRWVFASNVPLGVLIIMG